jgi:alkanesulfonate monooxygenase SsuD/methylene tetrahydromethanopterin reductase-like flavin-dependent oxidoreductase (luciferase family)
MRIAAEYADGWNIGFYPSNTPTGFGRKVKALDRYCKELGRDPKKLRKSWHGEVVIGETEVDVNEKVALPKKSFSNLDLDYNVARIIGTPDECFNQIQQYINLGASYFMLKFAGAEKIDSLRLFAERVLPHLRQENSGT